MSSSNLNDMILELSNTIIVIDRKIYEQHFGEVGIKNIRRKTQYEREKQKFLDRGREKYEKNADKTYLCDCGKTVTKVNLNHQNTKLHKKLLEEKTISEE